MTTARATVPFADGSPIRVSLFGSSRRKATGASRRQTPTDDRHLQIVSDFDLAGAYDRHASALLGFAINTLRDKPAAEDCVQETFLRAWRAGARFDPARGSERTWLFAIARNVIVDAARARRADVLTASDELDREHPAETWDPLDHLALIEGLARLSDEHRDVLVAVHLVGRSYADLSTATGVPVATLRSRTHYALRALRTHLEETEPSDG